VCNPRTGFAGCPHEQSAAARLWAGGLCIDRAPGSGAPLPLSVDCARSAPDHTAQRAAHSAVHRARARQTTPPAPRTAGGACQSGRDRHCCCRLCWPHSTAAAGGGRRRRPRRRSLAPGGGVAHHLARATASLHQPADAVRVTWGQAPIPPISQTVTHYYNFVRSNAGFCVDKTEKPYIIEARFTILVSTKGQR